MNSTTAEFAVRQAAEFDVPEILRIYNDAVLNITATFDTIPDSLDGRLKWFRSHGARHPILVLEHEGAVKGWASLSEWSTRCAYSNTLEDSIYIDEGFRGRGAGKLLLNRLIEAGRAAGIHTILARIATTQKVSIHLHERAGFQVVGTMREVGEKFGKLLDVCVMQYMYASEPQSGS